MRRKSPWLHLTSPHLTSHTHKHTWLRRNTSRGTHSLMRNLHSKNTWAQTDTFWPPRGQTVTWRGLGRWSVCSPPTSLQRFTACLFFERDTPPSCQQAPLIKFLKTTSVTQTGLWLWDWLQAKYKLWKTWQPTSKKLDEMRWYVKLNEAAVLYFLF